MRIKFLFLLVAVFVTASVSAQLAVAKMVGKNADKYKLGFGVFGYYDFPVNEIGNNSIRIELLDLAYFSGKRPDSSAGYISIKLGFRHIFSTETKTGFYIEPQVGYCRVVLTDVYDATYGDGVAFAMEGGYTIEMGENGNNLNFGLKYETDRAGKAHTISSVGFRVSYDFHLFRRRNN
ncbi:MAG: hypothetical protein ABI675_11125 [Chitinophagaceae bacterium]